VSNAYSGKSGKLTFNSFHALLTHPDKSGWRPGFMQPNTSPVIESGDKLGQVTGRARTAGLFASRGSA
jgi:hypothetical protein